MIDFKISDKVIELLQRVKVNKKGQREMMVLEKGVDIVRYARPDDIVPNKMQYYNKCNLAGTQFVLTSFSPLVEWRTIVELCKWGHIVVKKDFKK